jgi:hypothetical protein
LVSARPWIQSSAKIKREGGKEERGKERGKKER